MHIVLFTGDLAVLSRVEGAAAQMGATVQMSSSVEQTVACVSAAALDLLILDLATPTIEIDALLQAALLDTMHPSRVIAFGPHVHVDRLAAAREAGCKEVVSRGQFFSHLDSILAGGSTP